MNLNEAIKHCDDVMSNCDNIDCIADHYQLRNWLSELKKLRNNE